MAKRSFSVSTGRARPGRLLVRASGTEPLIRVMVEAEDQALVAALMDDITHAVERASRAS